MPFVGLLITSSAFLLPAWVAKRKKKRGFEWACKALTATSLVFHSRLFHPYALWIDKLYVHSFAVFYGVKSFVFALRRCSIPHGIMCSLAAIPLGIYNHKVRGTDGLESQLWHMMFHVSGQACLIVYVNFF